MKYLIFVIDNAIGSATAAEMSEIDKFNDQLRANENWIFAGGISSPETGDVIDNRNSAGIQTGKPLFNGPENYSGFWLIQVKSAAEAKELALSASKACNRKVELRPLLG